MRELTDDEELHLEKLAYQLSTELRKKVAEIKKKLLSKYPKKFSKHVRSSKADLLTEMAFSLENEDPEVSDILHSW